MTRNELNRIIKIVPLRTFLNRRGAEAKLTGGREECACQSRGQQLNLRERYEEAMKDLELYLDAAF